MSCQSCDHAYVYFPVLQYITLLDVDELIVPSKHRNLHHLFNRLEAVDHISANYDAIMFRQTYFLPGSPQPPPGRNDRLKHLRKHLYGHPLKIEQEVKAARVQRAGTTPVSFAWIS